MTICPHCHMDTEQPAREPDLLDAEIKYNLRPMSIREAIKEYFRFNVKWETKTARQWIEWAVQQDITPEQIRHASEVWRMDKRFNWQIPNLQLLFEKWDLLVADDPNLSPTTRTASKIDLLRQRSEYAEAD